MTDKQLADYAEQERVKITKFFKEWKGELPNIGFEKIIDQSLFINTSLQRLKQSHHSADFKANIIRLKKYKKAIENLIL